MGAHEPTAYDSVESVIFVVHGVGTQDSTDILLDIEQGLWACNVNSDDPWLTKVISFGNLPILDGTNSDVPVVLTQKSARTHLIIPVEWSRTRHRLFDELPDTTAWRFSYLLSKGLWAVLGKVCINIWRCALVARTLFWSVVLGALAAVFAALVLVGAAIICGIFYLTWTVSLLLFRVLVEPVLRNKNWLGLLRELTWLPFIVGLLLSWMAILSLPVAIVYRLYDFIADVVFLVADRARRNALEVRLRELFEVTVAAVSPRRALVVAHSLGTILVTQAFASGRQSLSRDVQLLTLGSPLNLMADVFGTVIDGPARLMSNNVFAANVRRWTNCWRDCDLIGRRLQRRGMNGLEEFSLGPGQHSNYWADAALWRTIDALISSAAVGNSHDRSENELERDDASTLRRARRHRFIAIATSCGMVITDYMLGVAVKSTSGLLHGFTYYLTCMLWSAAIAATAVGGSATVALARLRLRSHREVGSYRLINAVLYCGGSSICCNFGHDAGIRPIGPTIALSFRNQKDG